MVGYTQPLKDNNGLASVYLFFSVNASWLLGLLLFIAWPMHILFGARSENENIVTTMYAQRYNNVHIFRTHLKTKAN